MAGEQEMGPLQKQKLMNDRKTPIEKLQEMDGGPPAQPEVAPDEGDQIDFAAELASIKEDNAALARARAEDRESFLQEMSRIRRENQEQLTALQEKQLEVLSSMAQPRQEADPEPDDYDEYEDPGLTKIARSIKGLGRGMEKYRDDMQTLVNRVQTMESAQESNQRQAVIQQINSFVTDKVKNHEAFGGIPERYLDSPISKIVGLIQATDGVTWEQIPQIVDRGIDQEARAINSDYVSRKAPEANRFAKKPPEQAAPAQAPPSHRGGGGTPPIAGEQGGGDLMSGLLPKGIEFDANNAAMRKSVGLGVLQRLEKQRQQT